MSDFTSIASEVGTGLSGLLNPLFGTQTVTTVENPTGSAAKKTDESDNSTVIIVVVVIVVIVIAGAFLIFKKK